LFPLSIKTTIAMRRLKPEVDKLNETFKDDAQAKNLAMMELWKKHGVNPFGGCLPQLVQMPVWFAMYTTLQTAVEMYHTKFLWFPDLSTPDPFFVLPLVLGVFMIVQQRIVPQQGMDPVQQKMMMYHAGRIHGHDALPFRRARRLHADEQRSLGIAAAARGRAHRVGRHVAGKEIRKRRPEEGRAPGRNTAKTARADRESKTLRGERACRPKSHADGSVPRRNVSLASSTCLEKMEMDAEVTLAPDDGEEGSEADEIRLRDRGPTPAASSEARRRARGDPVPDHAHRPPPRAAQAHRRRRGGYRARHEDQLARWRASLARASRKRARSSRSIP
jgi:hypothetical protein